MNLIVKLALIAWRNIWLPQALHSRNPVDIDLLTCWDHAYNYDAKIFHLHTPKAAGCSVVSDLSSLVGRKNIYSDERCFRLSDSANFTALQDRVVMIRQPREHVFSQYQFCKLASDPGYRSTLRYLRGLPGQTNFHSIWRIRSRIGRTNGRAVLAMAATASTKTTSSVTVRTTCKHPDWRAKTTTSALQLLTSMPQNAALMLRPCWV